MDTGVIVGAVHQRDTLHAQAFRLLEDADAGRLGTVILTDFVLAEVMNFIVRKGGSAAARAVMDRIQGSSSFPVERIPEAAWIEGKDEVFRRFDGLSLVDAMTCAFMRRLGIRRLYSFDKGFDGVPWIVRLETNPK